MKNLYFCSAQKHALMELVFKNGEGQPATNSLLVAQKFGKRHGSVLRAIHGIEADMSEVSENECRRIFEVASRLIEQPNGGWREEQYYEMTRDGFSLLVMGFTGKEALQFKLVFLDAFNRMEETLRNGLHVQDELARSICVRMEQYIDRRLADRNISTPGIAKELDVRENEEAYRFFNGYCIDESRGLYLDKRIAAGYYANACVLNAIEKLLLKLYGVRGRSRKYNQAFFWAQAVQLVRQVNVEKFSHSLPENPRRLRAKYMNYIKDGYKSLVHRGVGNESARK